MDAPGKPKLLCLGTGYVGGSVLQRLLEEFSYDITASTRRDGHAEKLRHLGCQVLQASLDDADAITKAVADSDIIINTASSDHPGSVESTLKGIRERSSAGKKTIYIHTSGTGVLDDRAGGEQRDATIFTDAKPDQLEALDDEQAHRRIDKSIARAADELKDTATIRVLLPPLIFGKGDGPFNTLSMQIPTLLRASLKLGYPAMHGQGLATWSNVHVLDLADAYVTLLHALEHGKLPAKSPYDVYVFAESGHEHKWADLAMAYGKEMFDRDLIKSSEPKPCPQDRLEEFGFVVPGKQLGTKCDYFTVGGNSRSRATKLRELGWSPSRPDVYACLSGDIDVVSHESS